MAALYKTQIQELLQQKNSQKILTFMIVHDLKHPTESLISLVRINAKHITEMKDQLRKIKLAQAELKTRFFSRKANA